MAEVNRSSINNSMSKQMYTFSKSNRFPDHKGLNKEICYNTYDLFGKDRAVTKPFNHTTTRFNYYASPCKHGKSPSPLSYQLGDTFGTQSR